MQACTDISPRLKEIMTYISYDNTMYLNNLLEKLRKHFLEAYEHSGHVVSVTREMAINCHMTKEETAKISLAALLHDIGKLCIPTEILAKKGKLTNNEFSQIKMHPAAGYLLIKDHVPEDVAVAVLMHHERMDGSGYPLRAIDKNISEYAKIIMLADSFTAMTVDRVYRKALSKEEALIELHKNEPCYEIKYLKVLENIIGKNLDVQMKYKTVAE